MKTHTCTSLAGWSPQQVLLGACPRAAAQGSLLCLHGEERVQAQSLWQRFYLTAKTTKRPEVYRGGSPDHPGPSPDLQRLQQGCSAGRNEDAQLPKLVFCWSHFLHGLTLRSGSQLKPRGHDGKHPGTSRQI